MGVRVPKNKIYVQPYMQEVEGESELIMLSGEIVEDTGAHTFQVDVGDFHEDWDREEKISYVKHVIKEHPGDFKFITLA